MAILALDQGTSGSKAVVVDQEGIHSVVENPIRPKYLSRGGVEQDPEEIYNSLVDAGKKAVAQASLPIDGVALANQGESVLAWDPETGKPLTQCIVWQDKRSEAVTERLSEHARRIHELTALVLDSYFTAPKLVWVRENLTREGVVTTTDAWIVHRLTGEFVTDSSTASRSLLLDVDKVEWSGELLQIFGLRDERLPRVVTSDEIVGETTVFGDAAPVGGLMVDQSAALLAEGCLERGEGKCTYGTGAFLLVNAGRRAPRFDNGLTTSVAWTLRGDTSYCVDGQIYTAGSAVRWMQELGILDDPNTLDDIEAESSEGVLCGPSFAGLAAPWWRPDAGAFLTGMRLATGKAQIIRAVLEGISAQVAEFVELVQTQLGAPLQRLKVDGGLTRSRVMMQIQSDLLQVPVETYPSAHATALGVAAALRVALDPELDVREAVYPWQPEATYLPRISADAAHEFRRRWQKAVQANMDF